MLKALGPKPVSASTKIGKLQTSVILLKSVKTSSIEDIARSGMPSDPAATPPPDRYIALNPEALAKSA